MACYTYIFKDEQGNEQGRMSVCSGTSVKREKGPPKLAEKIAVGDRVFFAGMWPKTVSEIEVS